jgi:FAD:protein FMN transferase
VSAAAADRGDVVAGAAATNGGGVMASAAKVAWTALGTTAEVVVTDPDALSSAHRAVLAEVAAIDAACSRFRPDSELVALNRAAGGPVPVSPLLGEALDVALEAARRSGGTVDPTVGAALLAAGYDDDFARLPADGPAIVARPAPGWRKVRRDREAGTVTVPRGVQIDLGATAKALAADRAARAAALALPGVGVLVNLGGDVAVAGPPPGDGWPVGVADGHRDARPAASVLVRAGGLATSSTTQRRWRRGGRVMHHILDPRTGAPVAPVWRTVSVAGASCVEANTASTAAIVWGAQARRRLSRARVHARLVSADGRVETTGGWPR